MLGVQRLTAAFFWMAVIAAMIVLGKAAPVEANQKYDITAWYPGWDTAGMSDYESLSRHASVVDEVNPYWYALKPDGSVRPYDRAADPRMLSLAREEGVTVTHRLSQTSLIRSGCIARSQARLCATHT